MAGSFNVNVDWRKITFALTLESSDEEPATSVLPASSLKPPSNVTSASNVKVRHAKPSDQELDQLEIGRNEPATMKATTWAVNVFSNWAQENNITMDSNVHKSDP